MNLLRRHIGRRVAGVGVGVALLVLGLEAPAFAVPAVTSFTPTTGPDNCVIALTGTGFTDVPKVEEDVVFVGPVAGPSDDIVLDGANPTEAALFARFSSTELWVQVPNLPAVDNPPAGPGPEDIPAKRLTLGVGYTIRVDGGGTGTASTTTFTRVDGGGGCAPTITSVVPNCGTTDTVVKITGTNLIGPGLVGADTRFAPYTTAASHSVPDVDTTKSLSVVVPSGSADGLVRVTTFSTTGGTAFSPAPPFDISDACAPVTGAEHARSVTLSLRKHLVARGKVSSTEDPAFTDCVASVPVKIQRRVSGHWKTVGSTTTSDTGAYKKRIKDKPGKYRAKAPKVSLGTPVTDVCLGARSPARRHTH